MSQMKYIVALALLLCACQGPRSSSSAEAGRGIWIERAQTQARIPFELIDNRIFVEARINGAGPFHMVFDTGGSNIVTPEVAQALGLDLRDQFGMPGAGEREEPAWRTHVGEAALGDIRMTNLDFTVLSLEQINRAIGFERADGLVGHELLRRFVVRVDYDRQELLFAEPGHTPAHWFAGSELPFTYAGNLPAIQARLNGVELNAIIDTGDRSSLTLFGPYVADHGLREAQRPRLRAVTGWGVGGPLPADVTQSASFEIAGHTLRNVTTRMPLTQSGVFASRIADASIGNGVMKRFAVTFDYARQRLYLQPNAEFATPDPFDRSGMWVRTPEGAARGVEISDVAPATPAAEAGLLAGDRIIAVDGVRDDVTPIQLRDRLAAAPNGARFRLRVTNTQGERETTLVLRAPSGAPPT